MKFDYQKEYREQIKKNISIVIDNINTKDMKLKIENWADKFGYTFNEIHNKIIVDKIFRCVFSKDPSKQNIYENLAFSFIEKMPNVENLKKGKNTYFIEGKPTKNNKSNSKSIDFIWKSVINGISHECYAYHKHTQGSGGAQDNQFKDVKSFINNCRNSQGYIENNIFFFVICDGNYYTDKKLKELKNIAGPNLQVLTISELYIFLRSQIT